MWCMASRRSRPNSRCGPSATNAAGGRRSGWPWLVGGLLVACLAVTGCPLVWQRVSVNATIAPEDVAFIVSGHTTLADIVARLGAPDEITTFDDESAYSIFRRSEKRNAPRPETASLPGAIARYRFVDAKRFRANFAWWMQFVLTPPGVPNDAVLQGVGVGADEFLVIFDSDWIVRHHAFARHADASQFWHWPFDPDPPDENQVFSH